MSSKTIKSIAVKWLEKNLWSMLGDPLRDQDTTTVKEVHALPDRMKEPQLLKSVGYYI